MLSLIKQEIIINKMITYVKAAVVSCSILVVFIYFIAFVANVENEVQFQNYSNIFRFTVVMSLLIYSILAAIMHSRFIIHSYSVVRMTLLFSYPVSRKKILFIKILIVSLFTTSVMIISSIIPIVLFCFTETYAPIVNDTITANLLTDTLQAIGLNALVMNGVGIISMRIGFINRSIPTTLVAAFILAGISGNSAIAASGNALLSMVIIVITLFASVAVIMDLADKINKMEVC